MSNAEQLERETEQARNQLADTLDELRASMTPGRVMDQFTEQLREGAPAEFARNLKDQVVGNPLPLAIMGASLAWLMLGPRASSGATGGVSRANDVSTYDGAPASGVQTRFAEGVDSTMDSAKDAASQAKGSMRDAAGSLSDSARQAAGSLRETAGSMADAASRTVSSISESTKSAGQRTLQTGSSLMDFCREQPLLVAGLGVVVGALMGALVPKTETEDRLMGDASDRMKEQAKDVASQSVDTIGERAEAAVADASGTAEKPGERSRQAASPSAKPDQSKAEPERFKADSVQGDRLKTEPSKTDKTETDHPTLVPAEEHSSDDQWRDRTSEATDGPVYAPAVHTDDHR